MKQSYVAARTYRNAICLPCSGAENGPVVPGVKGGLYREHHTPIPEGLLSRQHLHVKLRSRDSISQVGKEDAPVYPIQQPGVLGETRHVLKGSYIYAGLLFLHFGHFLLESLARLWFIKQHPDIPVLWVGAHRQPELLSFQEEMLELLGVQNRIHVLTEQSEIEELIVPEVGYMIESEFSPEQKQALKVLEQVPLKKGKRVWLSRRNARSGRFLNERALEHVLEAEGWIIYQPEAHGVRDQIHFLRDAEHIAGIAGSAHHLLLLLPDYQGRVSIFPRGRTISGDLRTIASTLGRDQTIYFEATMNCTPNLPSWMRDRCWTDLNAVLESLG